MNVGMLVLGLVLGCGGAQPVSDTTLRFRVTVPASAGSGQTHLLLHDVTVPANRPVVLRAYAVTPDGSRVYLGSSGLPGISPDAQRMTSRPLLRIDATTGLRRWAAAAKDTREVDIEISPEAAGDSVSSHLPWSVRSVELVQAH